MNLFEKLLGGKDMKSNLSSIIKLFAFLILCLPSNIFAMEVAVVASKANKKSSQIELSDEILNSAQGSQFTSKAWTEYAYIIDAFVAHGSRKNI